MRPDPAAQNSLLDTASRENPMTVHRDLIATRQAHLRVPVTGAENAKILVAPVVADAGESGPERPRSRPRR
jgi:hypothetical protein